MSNEAKICLMFFIIYILFAVGSVIIPDFIENPPAWNPIDYARITDVDYKAVVLDEENNGGNVLVTERITFDIHAASKNNLFWELWRDLPEDEVDGLKIDYKVKSVKQILEDGTEIIYSESPKLYWYDSDYTDKSGKYGPGKWYHSPGPYNEYYDRYECVFFYVDGLYREKVTFEIEYEIRNVALRYADCSELYLSMYSEETINFLESFKAEILFPNKDMPEFGNYYANTYGTNSNEFKFTESDTKNPGYHTFSIELDESDLKFRPYNEYLEFCLVSHGDDKHIFTEHAPNNIYSNDVYLEESMHEQSKYELAPGEFMFLKSIIFILSIIGIFLILKLAVTIINATRNKHIFYTPSMQMEYFREIPSNLDPIFASYLAFCKHKSSKKLKDNKDGFASIMMSLARKGYIELERFDNQKDWKFNNIRIVIKTTLPQVTEEEFTLNNYLYTNEYIDIEPLTLTEKYYYDLIMRHSHGMSISMFEFQNAVSSDYEYTDSFVRKIEAAPKRIGVGEGYFQKLDFDEPKKKLKAWSTFFLTLGILSITLVNILIYPTRLDLAFGSFFILGISFIIAALFINKESKKSILFTQLGEDEYIKWHGLYNFLNSETLMSERTVIELPLWEQYLVYATAFGISDKVIKALKIRCPDYDASPILRNSYYHSSSFRHSSRSFSSATRSASHTARSGGYGGYGGGGCGGGGGGGGH